MKSYGEAIEHWSAKKTVEVINWLLENYGLEGKFVKGELEGMWGRDVDFDLITLVMREDVYVVYKLKWQK